MKSRFYGLLCLAFLVTAPAAAENKVPRLDSLYDGWKSAAAPWMSAPEKAAFDALENDRERELFIREFWRARPPEQLPGGSLEEWWRRFAEARRRFEDLDNDRARAMIAAGVPAAEQVFGGCRGVLRPLRVWHYDRYQAEALGLELPPGPPGNGDDGGFDLVFRRDYGAKDGLFRTWSAEEGNESLSEDDAPWRRDVAQILAFSRERKCFRDGVSEERIVGRALTRAVSLQAVEEAAARQRFEPAWLDAFQRRLAAGELRLPADHLENNVAIGFPGRDATKVLTLGRLRVPVEPLRKGAAGQLFDRLRLLGEIQLGSYKAERFEHIYHLSGPSPSTEVLELDFYRRLRPGTYQLRLRLEDAYGRALLRRDLVLDVPIVDSAPRVLDDQRPAGGAPLRDLTRRRVLSMIHFPGLGIVPPAENAVGQVEISVVASGGNIDLVEMRLDGEKVGEDVAPPYAFTVDFGSSPGSHRLEATAYDAAGRAIARAKHRLEPSERPLKVTVERRGDEVEALVSLPTGEIIESLSLDLDGIPLIVSPAPPYTASLPTPLPADSRFVRAILKTRSGASSENLLLLDDSIPLEAVDVRWVEVYATVLDPAGRPVVGLDGEDFRISEDGTEQPLIRFDRVEDLPLQVILAMDTSESMRERLATAVDSARRFFETVLTPKDRAALVTFNHDLRLAVPFTPEVDRLALGTSGLTAFGGTRLHDAVVFTSGYVGGHDGRRALVLLSDGRDVESDFDADEAREFALRAGLAVYPILLGGASEETRGGLERLAQESGGRAFSIRTIAQLDGVYRRIEEELRSQYLLVYQAPEDEPGAIPGSFRRVEVETTREGLRPRAMRGYYR